MNKILSELRTLAQDQGNRLIFQYFTRRENTEALSVDRVMDVVQNHKTRHEVVALLQHLDQLNLVNFILGRRTHPSRVRFFYTPKSVGEVALGNSTSLIPVSASLDNLPSEIIIKKVPGGILIFIPQTASEPERRKVAASII